MPLKKKFIYSMGSAKSFIIQWFNNNIIQNDEPKDIVTFIIWLCNKIILLIMMGYHFSVIKWNKMLIMIVYYHYLMVSV